MVYTSILATGKNLRSPSPIRANKSKVDPVPDKPVYHGYTFSVVVSGERVFSLCIPCLQDEIHKDTFAP